MHSGYMERSLSGCCKDRQFTEACAAMMMNRALHVTVWNACGKPQLLGGRGFQVPVGPTERILAFGKADACKYRSRRPPVIAVSMRSSKELPSKLLPTAMVTVKLLQSYSAAAG